MKSDNDLLFEAKIQLTWEALREPSEGITQGLLRLHEAAGGQRCPEADFHRRIVQQGHDLPVVAQAQLCDAGHESRVRAGQPARLLGQDPELTRGEELPGVTGQLRMQEGQVQLMLPWIHREGQTGFVHRLQRGEGVEGHRLPLPDDHHQRVRKLPAHRGLPHQRVGPETLLQNPQAVPHRGVRCEGQEIQRLGPG